MRDADVSRLLSASTPVQFRDEQAIFARGDLARTVYIVLSGALPPGLALNQTSGALSGTPSAGGTYNFTIQASDQVGATGSRAYTLDVGTNSLTLSPATLPPGTQNTPYNQTVSASGGFSPYTYSVSAGGLPTGLTLNPNTGAITGTPR